MFFFFFVAPFCSCPASLVSRKFFAVGPGCAKCFFLLRSVGRRDLSAGPEQKKRKHHPGCFFFCSGPGERQGKEKPAPNGASPSPAFPRGRSKKKNTLGGVFFFALAPCRRPTGLLLPLPFAGAAAKKKTPWVVFFFFALAPCRRPTGLLLPVPFAGAAAKNKNTLGGVFFLLRPRADAHSPTAGLGGDASPSAGWCFFFCCGPARTGVVFCFFAVAPPGRSLTHGGLGRFRQGPGGVLFFAAAPPGLFRQ